MRAESGLKAVERDEPGVQTRFRDLETYLESKLIGGSMLVERLLIGLLAGGHLLVEGPPRRAS